MPELSCHFASKFWILFELNKFQLLAYTYSKIIVEYYAILNVRLCSEIKSYRNTEREWSKIYSTLPLTHQAIKKINYKFDLTGSVLDLSDRGRKRSARSVDNVSKVKDVFD